MISQPIKATLYFPGFDPVRESFGELVHRLFSLRMLVFFLLIQLIHISFVPHGVSGDEMLVLSMKFWFVCSVVYMMVHAVAISLLRLVAEFTRHFIYNQMVVAILGTVIVNYTMVLGREFMPFEYSVDEEHIWLFLLLNTVRLFIFEALVFYFVLGDGVHVTFRDTRVIEFQGRILRQKEILSIRTDGVTVQVKTFSAVYKTNMHMRDIVKQMDPNLGINIDPALWLSPNFVKGYRAENNRIVIILENGEEKVVGRAQQQATLDWIARHFLNDMTLA